MEVEDDAVGGKITTFELLPEKLRLATETFSLAGVTDVVTLIAGDAREHLPHLTGISFCFLDAEKEIYPDFYDLVIPRLVAGGLFLADNVTSHAEELEPFVDRALSDERLDAMVVPIGKGVLLCRNNAVA